MITEYQIVVDSKSGICDSIDSFKNLLNINSKIAVSNKEIRFNNKVFLFELDLSEFQNRYQNIFHLTIHLNSNDRTTDYLKLLRLIREIIHKNSLSFNVLWDDLSVKFCGEAYPLIHYTENLLRKLITKFMVTNVGLSWTDENLPKELKDGLSKTKKQRAPHSNILHNSDFIQLADVLFKPYSNKPIDVLFKDFRNGNKQVSNTEFENYLPKSNWERYFHNVVECEDQYFIKRWSQLYELRCLVAHNSFFSTDDLKKVKELTTSLNNIIEKAISALAKVKVPTQEKENLVENAAVNMNEVYGQFLQKWKELELAVISYVERNDKFDSKMESTIRNKITRPKILLSRDKMPYRRNINALINIRNNIVHQLEPGIKEKTLFKYIDEMETIIDGLR